MTVPNKINIPNHILWLFRAPPAQMQEEVKDGPLWLPPSRVTLGKLIHLPDP